MQARTNSWTTVEDYRYPAGWTGMKDAVERARSYCGELERGSILLFAEPPFELSAADRDFLLAQRQGGSPLHKNVSYRATEDLLRGVSAESGGDVERMRGIMRRYSRAVIGFVAAFLSPYAGRWQLYYASFRPLDEAGRLLPLHKRNDLLHVDAFPSRPTSGGRILRVFTNVNPSAPRIWNTGPRFSELAPHYAAQAGLARFAAHTRSPLRPLERGLRRVVGRTGLPVADRSAYDEFMLHFHNWLKENRAFQEDGRRTRDEFPPGATWLVFTDGVPHAVLSGQYALEQTFIIPREALVDPGSAPINVLEGLSGAALAK